MHTIFINSENSKTSDPHRLLLHLEDKIDLKISNIYVALSNLRIYSTWKKIKTINLSCHEQHGMKKLN